jgi:uncharacterized protein YukE
MGLIRAQSTGLQTLASDMAAAHAALNASVGELQAAKARLGPGFQSSMSAPAHAKAQEELNEALAAVGTLVKLAEDGVISQAERYAYIEQAATEGWG